MSNNQKEENKESTTFTFGKITYEVIFSPQLTGKDKKAREFLKKHPIPEEYRINKKK
jgi:hypothetical protein